MDRETRERVAKGTKGFREFRALCGPGCCVVPFSVPEQAYRDGISLAADEAFGDDLVIDGAWNLQLAEEPCQEVKPVELAQRDQGT